MMIRRVDLSQTDTPLPLIVSEQNDPRAWSNPRWSLRSTMAVYCISYTPSQLPEVKHALSISNSRTIMSFVVECPRDRPWSRTCRNDAYMWENKIKVSHRRAFLSSTVNRQIAKHSNQPLLVWFFISFQHWGRGDGLALRRALPGIFLLL